jgi:hypothetical protein
MQFKKLIWLSEIVGKSYHGREAISNSVALTHNLPPSGASMIDRGHGIRNGFPTVFFSWLTGQIPKLFIETTLSRPDAFPHQWGKRRGRDQSGPYLVSP